MTEQTLVEYRERLVTFSQLSALTGIKAATLWSRWSSGDRGEQLWRPLKKTGVRRPAGRNRSNTDLMRSQEAVSEQRQRKRKAIIEAVKTAHADMFAQPLIDSRLLTHAERNQIRRRVSSSAQRFWRVKGAWL